MADMIGQLITNTNVAHDIMSLSAHLYKSVGSVLEILCNDGDTICSNPQTFVQNNLSLIQNEIDVILKTQK